MRVSPTLVITGTIAGQALFSPVMSADMTISVEIPRLDVAEYHRPYVAIWLENADKAVAGNLAVWYDIKLKNNEGTKWLKDMKQWWRRTGRELTMPMDGLSGATRQVGEHSINFNSSAKPLADLPAGEYQLVVEAAREVGGRELLRIPFQWPPKKDESHAVKGEHELGAIALTLKPEFPNAQELIMKKSLAWIALGLALSAPLSAQAHRSWMLPSATVFSGNDPWVTVDLAISNDLFYFEHRPMGTENIKAYAPDGSEVKIENASTGRYRSVFDVQLATPGTYKITNVNAGLMANYKENGQPKRWRGTPETLAKEVPANAEELRVTQSSNRMEIFVTSGKPTTEILKPTGQGLELVPVTHPNDLFAKEAADFQFVIDGQPAANIEVTIIPGGIRYRDKLNEIKVTTDKDGNFSVTWPEPGMYWISASFQDEKPTTSVAQQRRASYTSTLEVLPQ